MDNAGSEGASSSSEPFRIRAQGLDVTDKFTCMVCLELPKKAIYQCKNGHFFCQECYDNPLLITCPCCRCKLPTGYNRIRNLMGERFLDEVVQVECPFKDNGCGKKMPRNLAESHAAGCSYNFQKFGNFVNLCKKLGYPNCNYELNKGTTAMAIQHFQTEHGFRVATSAQYQLELEDFKRTVNLRASSHIWTPLIAKLPEGHGHVLLVAMINKTEDFACLSIWLPDSSYYNPFRIQPPVQVEFAVTTRESLERCKLVFLQTPISIAESARLESIPCSIRAMVLKEYMREEEKMRIIIKLLTVQNKVGLRTLYCKINPPLPTFFSAGAIEKGRKWLEEEEAKSKLDRDNLWEFLFSLFDKPSKPEGYSYEEVDYVKGQSLLLVLRQGTVAQLNFLKSRGHNLNYVGCCGGTTLEYVLKTEAVKNIALEKLKILVDAGVDFSSLNNSNQGLLHLASRFGTENIVKYVVEELKLDVNCLDESGRTPLFYAGLNEDKGCAMKITQLLLEHGADPAIRTDTGSSLLQLAKPTYKRKLGEILRLHRASSSNRKN